jgi:hypothetical protein
MGRYLRRLRRSAIVQITGDTAPPLMPPLSPPHAMVLGHPLIRWHQRFPTAQATIVWLAEHSILVVAARSGPRQGEELAAAAHPVAATTTADLTSCSGRTGSAPERDRHAQGDREPQGEGERWPRRRRGESGLGFGLGEAALCALLYTRAVPPPPAVSCSSSARREGGGSATRRERGGGEGCSSCLDI